MDFDGLDLFFVVLAGGAVYDEFYGLNGTSITVSVSVLRSGGLLHYYLYFDAQRPLMWPLNLLPRGFCVPVL